MRSGKTLPVCDRLSKLPPKTKVLVVCPPQVVPVWHAEWKAYKTGNVPRLHVISSGKLLPKHREAIGRDWDVIVADEIHDYRHFSKRYQTLEWLAKNAWMCIGLTGTPIDRWLSELYYPLTWLSGGTFFGKYISKDVFHKEYCTPVNIRLGKHSPMEIRDDLRETFMAAVGEVSHTWANPLVEPPTHEVWEYPLTQHQKHLIAMVMEGIRPPHPFYKPDMAGMKKMHRKGKGRQLYGGFMIDEKSDVMPDFCATWKWFSLSLLVARIGYKRLVVWYTFSQEVIEIEDTLEQVFGARVKTYTQKALEAFRRDEVDVLICHPKAAGAGVDISHAESCIFVSRCANWTALMQAFYRMAGWSQGGKTVYHMVANHPMDKDDYGKMWEKAQATEEFYHEGQG